MARLLYTSLMAFFAVVSLFAQTNSSRNATTVNNLMAGSGITWATPQNAANAPDNSVARATQGITLVGVGVQSKVLRATGFDFSTATIANTDMVTGAGIQILFGTTATAVANIASVGINYKVDIRDANQAGEPIVGTATGSSTLAVLNTLGVLNFSNVQWDLSSLNGTSIKNSNYILDFSVHIPIIVGLDAIGGNLNLDVESFRLDFTTQQQSALSVNLLGFELKTDQKRQNVRIQWVTDSEMDIEQYIIEKSLNGTEWEQLASVKPNGSEGEYEVIDEKPANGVSYYRLIERNHNGKDQILKMEAVRFKKSTIQQFQYTQNTLRLQSDKASSYRMLVVGINGQILENRTWQVQEGYNEMPLWLNQSFHGMAVVQLSNNENNLTQKIQL